MFQEAKAFHGEGLESWDVSNVESMGYMFVGNDNMEADLSNWDVGNVVDMASMFRYAYSFNSDISNWNVQNAQYITEMFNSAYMFKQNLCGWFPKLPKHTETVNTSSSLMFRDSACPSKDDPTLDQTYVGQLCFPCDDTALRHEKSVAIESGNSVKQGWGSHHPGGPNSSATTMTSIIPIVVTLLGFLKNQLW